MQEDIIIKTEDRSINIRVESHKISDSDLVFKQTVSLCRELASVDFAESTGSTDAGRLKTPFIVHSGYQYDYEHDTHTETIPIWWSNMTASARAAEQYHFFAKLDASLVETLFGLGSGQEPRAFFWRDMTEKRDGMELVERETGAVLAAALYDNEGRKGTGILKIRVSWGDQFNLIVFMTYMTIIEKQERQRKKHWKWF